MTSWKQWGSPEGDINRSWENWGESRPGQLAVPASVQRHKIRSTKKNMKWKSWGQLGAYYESVDGNTTCGWSWEGEDFDSDNRARSLPDDDYDYQSQAHHEPPLVGNWGCAKMSIIRSDYAAESRRAAPSPESDEHQSWAVWGTRRSYVLEVPGDVWARIVTFLPPAELGPARLSLRPLHTVDVTYTCIKCGQASLWNRTVVCNACGAYCRDCADPIEVTERNMIPLAYWSVHSCGEHMVETRTCPGCTRYCVNCGRACCENCGFRGGRIDDSSRKEIACLACVMAACYFN